MGKEKTTEIFVLPEFEKIQFEGFHHFIYKGLIEELNYFPKIKDTDQEFEFCLLNKEYKLVEPLIKERDVVYQSSTYSLDSYIPVQLAQEKKKKHSAPFA